VRLERSRVIRNITFVYHRNDALTLSACSSVAIDDDPAYQSYAGRQ